MTCRCGHVQCYICSQNVVGYDHFGDQPGHCRLYDDTKLRLKQEVERAETRAIRQVLEKNKDMTKNDLMVDKEPAVRVPQMHGVLIGLQRPPENCLIE
jgi:hypothetical protein